MNRRTSRISRLHRNVWALTLTSFFMDISSEMVVNLVPLFLSSVLGVRTSIIGLIEGTAETTASLMKLFSGAISDRIGKRKSLAVLGYGLSALSKPFLYFSNSWGGILGVRFSDRLGKGIRTAPRDALLAGSTEPDSRGLAFGVQRSGDTAGAFIGLAIAALVIWLTQANETLLNRQTFQTIVLISIVPAVAAVMALAFIAREVAPDKEHTALAFSLSGFDGRYKAFLGIVILFTLGNSSDAFIILRAQERGLSLLQIMGMLMTFNLIYALLSSPAGALSDRIGRRKLILFGWLAYGLIYLGFAYAKTGAVVWILFGIYGLYYAVTEGAGKALIADLVPDQKRGTAYGLYNAAVGLTALPSSVIAGILWQGLGSWIGFGPQAPFLFGAGIALIAGLLFGMFVKEPAGR